MNDRNAVAYLILTAGALALAGGLLVPPSAGAVESRDALQAYSRFLLTVDPSRRARALDRALEEDPDSAFLHVEKARLALEQDRDLDQALALAEKAVSLDPESVPAHTMLARIHGRLAETGGPRQEERLSKAIHHMEALSAIPVAGVAGDDDHWRFLAELYELQARLGSEGEEGESLRKAIEAWRNVTDNRESRARTVLLLIRLGQRGEAAALLRRQLQDTPNWLQGRRLLVDILEEMARWEEAVQEQRLVLEADPEDQRMRLRLGRALDRLGRQEEALEQFERVLDREPTEDVERMALFLSGDLLERSARYPLAEARYRRLVSLFPDLPDARFELARFLQVRGRIDEAAAELETLLGGLEANRRERRRFLLRSAELLSDQGRLARAEDLLEEELEREPEDAAVALALIETWARSGEYRKAERLAGRKRRQLDEPGTFWLWEGQAALLQGDLGRGEDLLKQWVERREASARDLAMVAGAWSTAGYPARAADWFGRAAGAVDEDGEESARKKRRYLLQRAIALVDAGRSDEAEILFQGLREEAPGSLEVTFAWVRQILIPGARWEELLELSRELQRTNPGLRASRLWEAEALMEMGRLEEAASEASQASDEFPSSLTFAALGLEVTAREGRHGEALARARELARQDNTDLEGLLLLAERLRSGGALEQGVDLLDEFTGLYRKNPRLLFSLGVFHERLGEVDKAVEFFRQAIEKDPSFHSAMNYLGYTLVERGRDLQEARQLLERALVLDPNNPAYLDSLGWTFLLLDRPEAAAPLLEQAARRVPQDPVVRMHLARLREEQGRSEEALEGYLEALRRGLDERLDETRRRVLDLGGELPPPAP